MRFPFEATPEELQADLGAFVDAVFSCLESEFLVMPKGVGFVEYRVFEQGYEALKQSTDGFTRLEPGLVLEDVLATPVALLVLRAMLGFTPPEWAYVTSRRSGVEVPQGAARSLDRRVRLAPLKRLRVERVTAARLEALVTVACHLLVEGTPETPAGRLHRLDKADTRGGPAALRSLAAIGVPYAMLLYERFLGRPFAGHRDSVSELVGDFLESAIEEVLARAGVSFRKTKRAERIEGFDQAPDFIVPSEFNPQVVIEAKLTEDDGTARDKVTRVQHLAELATAGMPSGRHRFEVVACIAGRGFGVRRKDMEKLICHAGGQPATVYGKNGKPALLQKIDGYNNAARRTPWVVLVDLDGDADCAPPLLGDWLPEPAPNLCFRIAVREIEAWLMADTETLAAFLGVARKRIPRDPEDSDHPKEVMVNLARGSRRRAVREDMVPREGSGRTVGPAYTSRLIEYVEKWRPEVAARHAESLRRAIACLERLIEGAA